MKETSKNKDTSVIPKGLYCYTYENGQSRYCPYWSIRKDKPEQENGYCSYMEKGDWDIREEAVLTNEKTGETMQGVDAPFPIGLLWDACKECDINRD